MTEGWSNRGDVWSCIENVRIISVRIEHIMPILLVKRDLHHNLHWSTDSLHVPKPFINVKVLWWDLNILSDKRLSLLILQSYPESVIQMRSLKHVAETLVSLVIVAIRWASVRVEEGSIWCCIIVKGEFFRQITDCLLLCELLSI